MAVLHVEVSTTVKAPRSTVLDVYADYASWPRLFPTIGGVRLLARRGPRLVLEVDHVEGKVRNELVVRPPDAIDLWEEKRRYDARFSNRFETAAGGTRLTVRGDIRLKGRARLLQPFLRGHVRRQIQRLQLQPVKAEAEARARQAAEAALRNLTHTEEVKVTRREKVWFVSGTVSCAGYLFVPEPQARTGERLPVVILAHGFSGTMDRLVPHAERFAAAGIAALVFDYRSFGDSGGQPRQVVDLPAQREDLRAAIAWARGRGDLDPDRVALWGNSLGGAHVISVGADDPSIAAVVAQLPFNGFPRRVEGRSTGAALRLFGAIVWDSIKGRLHLEPFYIPMIGRPGELAVTTTQEAGRHIQTLTGGESATRWKNKVAPRGLLQMMRYRPALDAARLRAPLLVCAAEQDREIPVDSARALVDAAPRGVLRVYPGTHFDFYTAPAIRDRALADQLEFLDEHLHTPSRVA